MGERTLEETAEPSAGVDEALKRRVEEAYFNDAEDELVVVGVSETAEGTIAIEMQTPHGDTTHTEYVEGPTDGSLEGCPAFRRILALAGVSPLELDDLLGAHVPASFDPETGWTVGRERRADESAALEVERRRSLAASTAEWARRNTDWFVVVLLVGGELLIIALLIYLYA
ncbi:hypothetical protein [Natronobiforma cellulositropha]|uniref:hypothetical protein n=1 Tax=Natronobiforma cellulositropha TaxID=1679076 RepID=UPI0021D5B64C|nr:hypothetical protein [Natronobiforma cellulositropha]